MADYGYNTTGTGTGAGTGAGAGAGGAYGNSAVNADTRTTGQKIKGMFGDGNSTGTGAGTYGSGTTHTTTPSTNTNTHTGNTLGTSTGTGTATGPTTTGQKSQSAASSVGGVVAGIHGAGEKLRGEFNAGVDRAFNEPQGAVKNQGVADAGEREIETGHFAGSTKEREVGSGGARRF
ncbi:hypothetical protein LOCC1_G005385 [Lachnellula occidentalis]|uniref:Uncharacterized protein n=1 Tax=Lachnellula occidentalis TaxID=215460 RepID=A0A8H8UD13_9HELO|nr:hypothetical protein LOCC1_G005385 [Lachnellula occidentalis]